MAGTDGSGLRRVLGEASEEAVLRFSAYRTLGGRKRGIRSNMDAGWRMVGMD